MIIVGGGGGLVFLLFFFAVFVLIPVLFFRAARRTVLLGSASGPSHPGWSPPQPYSGWEVPQEPVLPPVSPADVVSLRDRLGHDVRTLEPGDDPVARQAMADASERLSTCTTLLERADSQAQLRTAWLAAVEGLTASRLVRARLGLDPGPEIPMPPSGRRLQAPTRIDVGGRTHVGGPAYEPGRPHWFPGGAYDGRYVPGGWYDAPFWPSGLILGSLGGFALGSLAAGAMFGDGLYDDGYYDTGVYGGDHGDGGFGDAGYGDGSVDGGFGGYGGGGEWGSTGDGWGGGDGGGWGGGSGGGDFGGGGDLGGGGDWGGGDWGGGGDFGGGGGGDGGSW